MRDQSKVCKRTDGWGEKEIQLHKKPERGGKKFKFPRKNSAPCRGSPI